LPTTVVGGGPRPDWLVNRDGLTGRLPPRTRAKEIWRVAEPMLAGAQDDATILAIRDMKRAGERGGLTLCPASPVARLGSFRPFRPTP